MQVKTLVALTFASLMANTAFAAPKACMQTVTGMFGNTKACFQSQGISEKTFKDLCESRMVPSSKLMKVSATYLNTNCPSGYKGACLNMRVGGDAKKKYACIIMKMKWILWKKAVNNYKANGLRAIRAALILSRFTCSLDGEM